MFNDWQIDFNKGGYVCRIDLAYQSYVYLLVTDESYGVHLVMDKYESLLKCGWIPTDIQSDRRIQYAKENAEQLYLDNSLEIHNIIHLEKLGGVLSDCHSALETLSDVSHHLSQLNCEVGSVQETLEAIYNKLPRQRPELAGHC